MATQDDKTKEARLRRLKDRLERATDPGDLTPYNRLVVVLKGILDLLADEL